MILPFIITVSTQMWNSDNPSYWNYKINLMILPFGMDLGLYGVTNDPSFWNYGINTDVELRKSLL